MEQIITDVWAHEYAARKAAGRPEEEEFEDLDFDTEKILEMERMPEDWDTVIEAGGNGPGN